MTAPPDPSNPDLLVGLFTYLQTNGLVRDPRDGTDATLPPVWIEPQHGVPAVGQTDGLGAVEVAQTMAIGLRFVTGVAPQVYENFLRNEHVEFMVRAKEANLAKEFEQQVRALINDRRGWQMANVPVNESLLFQDMQPLGTDNYGYNYSFRYSFLLWAPEP